MSVERVLLLPSAYLPNVGGIEEVTRRLAAGLTARGVDAWIVTNRWPDDLPQSERVEGIAVRRLAFHLPAANASQAVRFLTGSPLAVAQLRAFARAHRPQVVHVLGAGPNAAYVALLQRTLRAPVVLGTHGELSGDAHGAFDRSTTLRLALRRLCATAAAVTAPSAYTLRELERTFAVHGRSEVIANGVDVDELASGTARTDLGRYVVSVGRLVPQKGFPTVLEAFARARSRLGGRRLVIAGEGPERARLEVEIARLGLADAVVLLGAVAREELPALLRGADAFVLASTHEAFGLAALEAMAAGVPVVASDVGGIPEFAVDGQSALLVPVGDPVMLAGALERATSDDVGRTLAAGGRAVAASHTWAAVVDRHIGLYERIAGARR